MIFLFDKHFDNKFKIVRPATKSSLSTECRRLHPGGRRLGIRYLFSTLVLKVEQFSKKVGSALEFYLGLCSKCEVPGRADHGTGIPGVSGVGFSRR